MRYFFSNVQLSARDTGAQYMIALFLKYLDLLKTFQNYFYQSNVCVVLFCNSEAYKLSINSSLVHSDSLPGGIYFCDGFSCFFMIFSPDFFVNVHILLILDPFSSLLPHPRFMHFLVLVFLGDGNLVILLLLPLLLHLPSSFRVSITALALSGSVEPARSPAGLAAFTSQV